MGAQVKVAMAEKDKINKKTQLLRSKGRVLGSVADAKVRLSFAFVRHLHALSGIVRSAVQRGGVR